MPKIVVNIIKTRCKTFTTFLWTSLYTIQILYVFVNRYNQAVTNYLQLQSNYILEMVIVIITHI